MKTYFTINTDVKNAIDNVHYYGWSNLEPNDVVRLLGAHLKYSGGFQFINKDDIPEGTYALELPDILKKLDNMILHRKVVHTHRMVDHIDVLQFESLAIYDGDDGYYYLDLTKDGFKELSKDRTAMIAECRNVLKVMEFLFSHNIEFEFANSRAKLRLPVNHPNNEGVKVGSLCDEGRYTSIIRCPVFKTLTETTVEEIPSNN